MKVMPIIVALAEHPRGLKALQAAHAAFPGSETAQVRSIDEAVGLPIDGALQLLIVVDGLADDLERAAATLDSSGFPRWAIVSFEAGPELFGVDRLSESECEPACLACVLRHAVEKLQLRTQIARLRGDMLTIGVRIVHDLRSPLGGIVSCTEALGESLPTMTASQQALFRAVTESTHDLTHRIGQLSIWARRSGREPIASRFNMSSAIEPVLEHFEWKIAERGARISKPDAWPDVLGDPVVSEDIWRMLFENILRHAGKFSKVEAGWRPEGDSMIFYLQDDGEGVPAEKRPTLFYPFHRMHEPDACSGLDLPIIADLVSLQGGRCGFEEVHTGGSRFHFSLAAGNPLRPAA